MSTGSLDPAEVRLAPGGHVFVAAIGSAAPTDVTTALTSAWTDLGYIDDNGVSIKPTVNISDIMAWQSAMPVKETVTAMMLDVSFEMLQTDKATTSLFFMGATWVNGPSGVATLTVPSNPTISQLESAMVIEYTDDSSQIVRLYCARGIVTDRKEIKLDRKNAVKYGVTYKALDNSGTAFKIITNNDRLYS